MSGASSEDVLQTSSQQPVTDEGSTVNVSRSTPLLKLIKGNSGSEAADGLVISSLESSTSHRYRGFGLKSKG